MVVVGAAGPLVAQQIDVPSGLSVALDDVILEAEAQTARFRFIAPAIAEGPDAVTFGDVVDDLQYLCDAVIVPALQSQGWTSGDVVMSLSDQPVDFGEYDPAVTQFFQPFRLQDAACIWEDF
ncbi:DUF6497 family protein [Loktanella fryxellensis]|nr:DUF6497 family protein [Loktanella fryxellensis]